MVCYIYEEYKIRVIIIVRDLGHVRAMTQNAFMALSKPFYMVYSHKYIFHFSADFYFRFSVMKIVRVKSIEEVLSPSVMVVPEVHSGILQ